MRNHSVSYLQRSKGTKELVKSLIFLASGLFLGFVGYATYLAFSKHPQAMEGILLFVGPFALFWAFERIWWHKRMREKAESRLFDWEQHKEEIIRAIGKQSAPAPASKMPDEEAVNDLLKLQGATQAEIIENLKHGMPDMNLEQMKRLKSKYKNWDKVVMVLLNGMRYYERNPQANPALSRNENEARSSSPTVIHFAS